MIEHRGCLAAHAGDQPALGVRHEVAASEQMEGRRVTLEQGPQAPAMEGPDRGDARRLAAELPAEVGEDVRRDALDGVERVAGHLEEANLQGERHSVQGAPALPDASKLLLVEREEVLDFEI